MAECRGDDVTIAATAICAMVVATAAHEAVGHGTACLLAGGTIARLTSVYFDCTARNAGIPLAGPLGNLVCAALAAFALRLLPKASICARLAALLLAAFSLFWFAGYLVYAMTLATGDFAFAARDLTGGLTPATRLVAGVAGVILYGLAARWVRRAAKALGIGRDALRVSWLAATAAAIAAALLYAPDRIGAAVQAGLEIGAASLPLLWSGGEARTVAPRGWSWIAAGVLAFAGFAVTLGRGLG